MGALGTNAPTSQFPDRPPLYAESAYQPAMGKLDRAAGALCIALAGFGAIAASQSMHATGSQPSWAVGLAGTPALVTLILSLLAAIPGFFLVFRKGAV